MVEVPENPMIIVFLAGIIEGNFHVVNPIADEDKKTIKKGRLFLVKGIAFHDAPA